MGTAASDHGDPHLYARSFFDVYDQWYGNLDDPAEVVAAFGHRCPPASALLELGSGTGRLAIPLADAGFSVLALDAAVPMLRQSASGANSLAADMQQTPLRDDCVGGVLIAYNTFFNLTSRQAQRRCLAEIARVLTPDGLLALDVFLAPADHGAYGMTITEHPVVSGARLAVVTGPDQHDPMVIVGSHIELASTTTCRPWRIAYASPAELDDMAQRAGLTLVDRHDDWSGNAFDAEESWRHVSWYRHP